MKMGKGQHQPVPDPLAGKGYLVPADVIIRTQLWSPGQKLQFCFPDHGRALFLPDIALGGLFQEGQRIGDLLAKTILISTNTRSNIEETVFQEVADNYTLPFRR